MNHELVKVRAALRDEMGKLMRMCDMKEARIVCLDSIIVHIGMLMDVVAEEQADARARGAQFFND